MCLGDQATVTSVDAAAGTATVDVGGRERTVSLALHPDVGVGAQVVVHTGFVVEVLGGTADDAGDEPQGHGGGQV